MGVCTTLQVAQVLWNCRRRGMLHGVQCVSHPSQLQRHVQLLCRVRTPLSLLQPCRIALALRITHYACMH